MLNTKDNRKTQKVGNDLGFGLIEVLISFGLVSVLVLALMRVMEQQSKQNKTAALNNEVLNVQRLFQTTISEDLACLATFAGIIPNDELIPSIRMTSDLSTLPFAKAGEVFGNSGIKIIEIKVLSAASAFAKGLIKNNSYFCKENEGICTVWIQVTVEKVGDIYGGKQKIFYNFLKGRFAHVEMISECDQIEAVKSCREKAESQSATFIISPLDPNDPSGNLVRIDCPGNKGRIIQCSIYSDLQPLIECRN